MKDAFNRLNKVFDSKVRLGIMSLMMVNEWVSYNEIKQALSPNWPKEKISDGNLASHIKKLRGEEYLDERKEFLNRRPHTTYRATQAGTKAFEDHLSALEEIINMSKM
ncbi:MAG: winged helix-turn-helix domain-containing protein [Bacteroidia bacterium]